MYLRIINNEINYPYSLQKLREDNPHSSLPSQMTEAMMNEFDVFEVRPTPKPNNHTKNISEATPLLVEGVYYQNWEVVDASLEEINSRIEFKWDEIREIRNSLLQECDWTQLGDISSETKEIWSTYRQNLRDITNQSNPFNIEWPVKP
jgi:hypothetical protein